MIIDTHSHLFDPQFDADRDVVIGRMKAAGVATITVGTNFNESVKAIEIAEKYSMWATVGQHPTDTFEEFDYAKYKKLADNKRAVGVGECGLDYFQMRHSKLSPEEEKVRQRKLFEQHISLAREVDKPLMVHVRDAYRDAYEILKDNNARGVIHFFIGTWEEAKLFLDLGFALSFSGVITFPPKADPSSGGQYNEVVKNVPIDMFTIETDSPYVAPSPYRGKRNEPIYVLEVAKKVAELKGMSLEDVLEVTVVNTKRVFGIPD
ncbi:MAG: TatD family hydrolase [Patescibacteria group bacterium]